MATKYVYGFGPTGADGDASMKNELGGKGANLAEMCRLGLPVPAGFTITHRVLHGLLQRGATVPPVAQGRSRRRAGQDRSRPWA